MKKLQEMKTVALTGREITRAIEEMDTEITDGAFVCDECREEWELEKDIIIFGLCGNCYNNGEIAS